VQASHVPFAAGPEWTGTERYSVLRRVGEGGMGVVYEALDREGRRNVALKTLRGIEPNSIYLFKHEFRTLAGVHHRNLVHLYELVQLEDGSLFFAMELVHGTDFIEYVHRAPRDRGRDGPSSTMHAGTAGPVTRQGPAQPGHLSIAPTPTMGDQPTRADAGRLRPALRQLVQGLGALHRAGKLHRDVKPSNVLVTPEGRVVILDFGIAIELSHAVDDVDQSVGGVVGTPKYMSPEQVVGEVPTPASDWYSVGVMLYEALAGRLPFEGSSMDVLSRKVVEHVLPPSTWARGIPPDLEELCVALLRQEPSERPDGAEILRRLGAVGGPSSFPPELERAGEAHSPLLVGREEQLRALREALEQVTTGQAVTVRVGGGSGMGKSALVQHFLDQLGASGEVEMLCGRAYERESVPYKAVDSLVDSLARLLIRIEEAEGPFATPEHAPALARLFPVLKRVPSFADLQVQAVDDAQAVRHKAFGALRGLLGSLARRRPLVLYIDDVQWGDVDSVALLREVIRAPKAPPLLLLMTYREEGAATSPFMIEMNDRWPPAADLRDVSVGPLDARDAQRLAIEWIGASDEVAQRTARAVAREAGGNPFLVEELVRGNRTRSPGTDATLTALTLAQIVSDRLDRLPEAARHLAEVAAVGGRPMTLSVLIEACCDASVTDEHVQLLRSSSLVRMGFRDGRDVIEPCHDRIRETIVEQLRRDVLRAHHGGLARALEAASGADPEAIAVHLLGSGERERGARYAQQAADQAAAKLAFDHAARLYRLALETVPRTPDEARPVRIRLATALEQAGERGEAAKVYLEAAAGAPPLARVDLERAASAQLLLSGRTDEGAELLRRVLAAVGLKAPRTPLGAILSLLFHTLVLRIRGVKFEERSPEEVSLEDQVRLATLHTVALGFSVVDVVLAACMQARFLRLALDVGHRAHVLEATASQFSQLASQGGSIGKAELDTYAIAERLSKTLNTPDAKSYFAVCQGLAFFQRGEFKKAREVLFSPSAMQYRKTSLGKLFGIYSLYYLGELREETRRAGRLLADSERRRDLFTAVNLRAAPLVDCCLVADDPDGGREHIRVALATWTQRGFHIQHWQAMVWGAQIELYVGDGAAAYARLARNRRSYRRSLLDHSQFVRVITHYMLGCAAVASSQDAPPDVRRARLKEARAAGRRLERERMPWSEPLANLTVAAVANIEGDRATAATALRLAIERAEAADMVLHAAAARYQLGCLLGGDEGDEQRRQGESAMAAQGVRAPARMATMFLPGRWGSAESSVRGVAPKPP
jgi:serine/threonine protein kinase/tetratricopeptide (TPR) repeat protein